METKDPIEQIREYARKLDDIAAGDSERGFSPLGLLFEAIANGIESQYMKLPVDADGVPIRPGDEMQMAFGESAEVVAVDSERWFYDQSCLDDDCGEYDYEWAMNSHHVKPGTEAVGNTVHVSREDWDDMSEAMDKLRAERDRLAEGLRCMTVERDFWRKCCRSQDETIGGLADKLADEGMA